MSAWPILRLQVKYALKPIGALARRAKGVPDAPRSILECLQTRLRRRSAGPSAGEKDRIAPCSRRPGSGEVDRHVFPSDPPLHHRSPSRRER